MMRATKVFHFILYITLASIFLQSAGLLCDDCVISFVFGSCEHTASDTEKNHQESSSSTPCENNLCSLCGYALCGLSGTTNAIHLSLNFFSSPLQIYLYKPIKEIFHPPRI